MIFVSIFGSLRCGLCKNSSVEIFLVALQLILTNADCCVKSSDDIQQKSIPLFPFERKIADDCDAEC